MTTSMPLFRALLTACSYSRTTSRGEILSPEVHAAVGAYLEGVGGYSNGVKRSMGFENLMRQTILLRRQRIAVLGCRNSQNTFLLRDPDEELQEQVFNTLQNLSQDEGRIVMVWAPP
ncbi:hypothetical protein CPC08DRAFT_458246 [Agrocybe pediades]|nr:hypothetical protein CPC08DRAFT_458246 [Agrocybe pediades]